MIYLGSSQEGFRLYPDDVLVTGGADYSIEFFVVDGTFGVVLARFSKCDSYNLFDAHFCVSKSIFEKGQWGKCWRCGANGGKIRHYLDLCLGGSNALMSIHDIHFRMFVEVALDAHLLRDK